MQLSYGGCKVHATPRGGQLGFKDKLVEMWKPVLERVRKEVFLVFLPSIRCCWGDTVIKTSTAHKEMASNKKGQLIKVPVSCTNKGADFLSLQKKLSISLGSRHFIFFFLVCLVFVFFFKLHTKVWKKLYFQKCRDKKHFKIWYNNMLMIPLYKKTPSNPSSVMQWFGAFSHHSRGKVQPVEAQD